MPKFQDFAAWQQAEVLMQPAFIRLIDNIRKQLDNSSWKGNYIDTSTWSPDVTEEVKFQVKQLQAELEKAAPAEVDQIEAALAALPAPVTSYQLCLEQNGQQVTIDLWNLCYQICFRDYDATGDRSSTSTEGGQDEVAVDTSLFDETGEVDWNRLDDKTRQVVEAIFAGLPG